MTGLRLLNKKKEFKMALPLIIPIAAGIASLYGIGKTAMAFIRNREAKKVYKEAESIALKAQELSNLSENELNSSFAKFSELKARVAEGSLSSFVNLYKEVEQITPLDFPNPISLPGGSSFTQPFMDNIEDNIDISLSSGILPHAALGLSLGALAGGLISFGAYKLTALFGETNLGREISELKGAAMKKAVLAWLGGGPLASQGLGVVGGEIVLTLLAMGPPLILLGVFSHRKARLNLINAKASKEKALEYERKTGDLRRETESLAGVVNKGIEALFKADERLRNAAEHVESLLKFQKDNPKEPNNLKAALFEAGKLAKTVKYIMDARIIGEDGKPIPSARETFDALSREPS
jgi:hypothetical protein